MKQQHKNVNMSVQWTWFLNLWAWHNSRGVDKISHSINQCISTAHCFRNLSRMKAEDFENKTVSIKKRWTMNMLRMNQGLIVTNPCPICSNTRPDEDQQNYWDKDHKDGDFSLNESIYDSNNPFISEIFK